MASVISDLALRVSTEFKALRLLIPPADRGKIWRVEVDLGSSGAPCQVITSPLAAATPGLKIIASISGDPPAGSFRDFEVNPMLVSARCEVIGSVILTLASPAGYGLFGRHAVNLVLE